MVYSVECLRSGDCVTIRVAGNVRKFVKKRLKQEIRNITDKKVKRTIFKADRSWIGSATFTV